MTLRSTNKVALDEALSAVAQAAPQIMGLDMAVELLKCIEYPECRLPTLTKLAVAATRSGDNRAVARVQEIIDAQDENWKVKNDVWGQLSNIAELDNALADVTTIGDENHRWIVLDALVQSMTQAGSKTRLARVAKIAELLQNMEQKAYVLNSVALALASLGEAYGAISAARSSLALSRAVLDADPAKYHGQDQSIFSPELFIEGWTLIKRAQSLTIEGKVDDAFALVDTLAGAGGKTAALRHIAWGLAYMNSGGHLGRMFAAVETIEYTAQRVEVLSELGRAMAHIGDKAGLRAVLEQIKAIKYSEHKPAALAAIAGALGSLGERDEALSVLQDTFAATHGLGCKALYDVLRDAVPIIADLAGGQALWQLYETVLEIDSW